MITDRQIQLIVGCLLHDIGKVVYKDGNGSHHSQNGYDYLQTDVGIVDDDILDCVRYHHEKYLQNASIAKDAIAYVAYFADQIAAFTDRREASDGETAFDKTTPLDSIFNILNVKQDEKRERRHYALQVLDSQKGVNYPTNEQKPIDPGIYESIVQNLTDHLRGMTLDKEYINSLLSIMETNLTYIPSSTMDQGLTDISLYDHAKITAAIASCVEQWLEQEGVQDYREALLQNAQESYKQNMFLLYSMDISGIQSFIYTIGEKGALKGLRARSFYLEIMMEHIVDELLEQLSLSRTNLIYSGGGHCYLLLPNTQKACQIVADYEKQLNQWMLQHFDTSLYVASGYAKASANTLRNIPEGSYSELYLTISKTISQKKSNRYSAEEIIQLNHRKHQDERECAVCRRIAKLQDNKCAVCNALEKMARDVMTHNFFTILDREEEGALPLPGEKYLVAENQSGIAKRMQQEGYIRCYTKNEIYPGTHSTTKLWVGDYRAKDTFEELAEQSTGIKRLAVLRADVDNLGNTFVSGFQGKDGDDRYVTLSRTAVLSRQLSLFFKGYINEILADGTETPFASGARNVVIVYSGGDDIFLVGAWNEVVASFIDLKNALHKFTQGALTISGGIGLYHDKFPINVMAKEVELLEDASKGVDGKDAITVFSTEHSYPWKEFQEQVAGEKFSVISEYFDQTDLHGMAFLYHMVELLRDRENRINIARYVYLLSRMEPGEEADAKQKNSYQKFSKNMYEWSQTDKDRRELITAIYLYVYLRRSEEEEGQSV